MNAVLEIIVPVFGMVTVGWGLAQSGLLSVEGLRGLTNVTFYALFPSLLFRSMGNVRLEVLSLDILLVFFGAALVLYGLMLLFGRALGMRLTDGAVFALSGTFSNGVGIGIPFVTYAFGEKGLVPLLMIISVNSLILLTFSSFLMEVAGQGKAPGRLLTKLGGAVLMMLKHPVIPSIFAGLIWAELAAHVQGGLALPVVLDRILQALGTAAPPCGLIMAGASLAHVGLKEHWQTAAVATAVKLAVLPAMVWLAGRYLFPLDPLWLTVATLNAALPAGANVYLVARLYNSGVGLATNAVVISTAVSIFTLSAILVLLDVQAR